MSPNLSCVRRFILPAFVLFQLSPIPQISAQTVKFAWLSDTHVGSAGAAEGLVSLVNDINDRTDLDFVILSGDVSEYGSNAQLQQAHDILGRLVLPLYAIPGNHEMRWSESGTTAFPRLFGGDKFLFSAGQYTFIGMHQGPRMRMADGYWAPEDMRWLDSALTALPPQTAIVFVTHYPLDSSIANWYRGTARLRRHNTRIILNGHGHANRIEEFEGICGIMGRSALATGGLSAGYNVVQLRGDSLIIAEHMPGMTGDSVWAGLHIHAPAPGAPAIDPTFSSPATFWRVQTGWTIGSSAAASDSLLFCGDASGTLRAFSLSSGEEKWQLRTGGPIYSSPAVSNRRVVFGSCDGRLYCLDGRTGVQRWSVDFGSPVLGTPVISGDTIFVAGGNDTFAAVELGSGKVIWQYKKIDGWIEAKPLLYRDLVIFGAWDGYLYGLKRTTGELSWKWHGDRPGILYSPAACTPVGAHGKLVIVAPDRQMTAIDASSGKTVWRTAQHQVRETIGVSSNGDMVFARLMRDSIVAVSAIDSIPVLVWATNCGFGYDINSAMISVCGNSLFYGTKNGVLLVLDSRDGTIISQERLSDGPLNTVLALDGSRAVTTGFDGVISLVETGKRRKAK